MTLNYPPQTFEEWYATGATRFISSPYELIEKAFAAGVASQQAEIERLRAGLVKYGYDRGRYEAVVEAARLFLMNMWDADVDAFPDMEQLRAALAAVPKEEKI